MGVLSTERIYSYLERIVRYLARPPVAQERLELCSGGRVGYTMKNVMARRVSII